MDTIEVRAATAPVPAAAPRPPRITNACEACRAAKVKCQASTQLGICKRCLDSKRECIFKTGPRTRRPRQKRPSPAAGATSNTATTSAPAAARYLPLPGPSKTFTIDIPMAADDDIADTLEALRLTHDKGLDLLVPHVSDGDDDEEAEAAADYDDYEYDHQQLDMDVDIDYDWLDRASGAGSSALSHASSLPVGASALSTPPSSVVYATAAAVQGLGQVEATAAAAAGRERSSGRAKSRTLASLRLQPQFNLDSAGKLLTTFREAMMGHFHCVVVREDDTVERMARERPFVLLAVLAAASGSCTLQGHSLYDEEFRKILGLKFVAGGERTLELLQGLVVYIAWYPFHLRPKNRQAVQYIRMVVDIVSDLELDVDPGTDSMDVPPTSERLDEIRVYLASYYLASSYASTWARTPPLTYTEYTARCSDLLQRHSQERGDHVLAWQARLERLVEETNDLRRTQRGRSQSEYQIGLMLRGMETQLSEWEARIAAASAIADSPSLRIAVLFTRVFLSGAPLLKLPSVKLPSLDAASAFRADPARLHAVVPHLHALYDYLLGLDPAVVNAFIGMEWGALILAIILGFRMSFPLVVCPEWDDQAARETIRFAHYVDRLCEMGGEGYDIASIQAGLSGTAAGANTNVNADAGGQPPRRSMDVLVASKIVLDMVRKKFQRKVAKLEAREAVAPPPHPVPSPATAGTGSGRAHREGLPSHNCPMMDGSLEPYYPYWDETFTNNLVASAFAATEGPDGGTAEAALGAGVTVPNELWTALTTDWAQSGAGVDFDAL